MHDLLGHDVFENSKNFGTCDNRCSFQAIEQCYTCGMSSSNEGLCVTCVGGFVCGTTCVEVCLNVCNGSCSGGCVGSCRNACAVLVMF